MKKLKTAEVFTRDGYTALTAAERRFYLKIEQAKEYSGLRPYPNTCAAVFDNIPAEWWAKYTAQHIGEVAALLKEVYAGTPPRLMSVSRRRNWLAAFLLRVANVPRYSRRRIACHRLPLRDLATAPQRQNR